MIFEVPFRVFDILEPHAGVMCVTVYKSSADVPNSFKIFVMLCLYGMLFCTAIRTRTSNQGPSRTHKPQIFRLLIERIVNSDKCQSTQLRTKTRTP